MSYDWNLNQICRDDDCKIVWMHRKHRIRRRLLFVHHRPTTSKKPPWQRDDPEALSESVLRATSEIYPMLISWIARDVRDDYGRCTDRTVYRHVKKLVNEAKLIKLDLGLAFAAYIRPKSRLLADPQALRDYMLSMMEITACTKESRA